ncbi:MAG: hypothetical protein V5B39_13220 [Accumulibacter sp.]|jgi:hypothetical protein|uniref:hypothetical protein n=1 Tax=Accumulibacter sp. TaxID=2053492 RepID=UPI002FC3AA78
MTFILRWFVGMGREVAGFPYTHRAQDLQASGERRSRYDISDVSAARIASRSEYVHAAEDKR